MTESHNTARQCAKVDGNSMRGLVSLKATHPKPTAPEADAIEADASEDDVFEYDAFEADAFEDNE